MEQTSNGPLLEFLVRNSIFMSTVTEDEIEGSLGCDLQVNYYNIDKVERLFKMYYFLSI